MLTITHPQQIVLASSEEHVLFPGGDSVLYKGKELFTLVKRERVKDVSKKDNWQRNTGHLTATSLDAPCQECLPD